MAFPAARGSLGVDIGASEKPVPEALPVIHEIAIAADVYEKLGAPRGAADDLTKLTGVGPQLVKKLNDGGIFHYWQLAAMTDADIVKTDLELKLNGRISRDKWIDQARGFLAGA